MSGSEFEGHEALIAQLRAGTLDAPDHVHRRVLASGQVKRRRWAEMSGRKRVLVVVPVAATLAVGAAVVHGAFFSGSKIAAMEPYRLSVSGATSANGSLGPENLTGKNGATGPKGPTGARGATGAEGPLAVLGPTGAAGPTGPTGVYYSATGTKAPAHGKLVQGDSLTIPTGRLVHADARLQVVVANRGALTRATNNATQIVTQLGGYAQNVEYQATEKGYGSAYLDLRVPLGKTEVAIEKLGGLGRLVSQQVSTQDLQQQYSKQTNTIGTLRRKIAIYEQALTNGSLSGSQRVEVQVELANAEHQLKQTRKARSHTVKSGTTAAIQLTLTTKQQHAVIVHPGKRGRLGRLLHDAGGFLGLEGIIVLYALIVAAPIAVLVALLWWLMRERRRREERLLANA